MLREAEVSDTGQPISVASLQPLSQAAVHPIALTKATPPDYNAMTAELGAIEGSHSLAFVSRVPKPRVDAKSMDVDPPSVLTPLQQWEGLVEQFHLEDGTFTARLYDLTADFAGVEYADFLLEDVDVDDHELVVPGSVFNWIIGYRDHVYGKRERISTLVFRRLPEWTEDDLDHAAAEAKELANAFSGG